MYYSNIEKYFQNIANLPLKDLNDLPSSPLTFQGGAHYRMEIAGVESAENFEKLVRESEKYQLPIHRIIGTVGGSTRLDDAELKAYAQIGHDAKIEVMLNPLSSRGTDNGRQYTTAEGYVSGMRIRGQYNLSLWLKEFARCLDAGIRGFLICDEGLLKVVAEMRAAGAIPAETKFKVSVFAGHANILGGQLLQGLGADSFNPLADLELPMLASIRSQVSLPMDVYMCIVDSMGGHQRFVEADEIARICAPVYFKFEPGKNECDLYNTWQDPALLSKLLERKVKYAQICHEWCQKSGYDLTFNDYREDLSYPRP